LPFFGENHLAFLRYLGRRVGDRDQTDEQPRRTASRAGASYNISFFNATPLPRLTTTRVPSVRVRP
jgi:hypothetical protein